MSTELHNELHTESNEIHNELHPPLHTLASIATELAVSKRAVQNWHKSAVAGERGEIGRIVDGQRVFSDSERAILLSYASDRAKAPKAKPSTVTIEPAPDAPTSAAITVIEGNHRQVLSAPCYGETINLGNQRGAIAVQSYGDPMAAAANALAVMGTNINAMATDLERQQNQLAQTAAAVAALKQQAEAMASAQQEYRIKSDVIALIQNQQTGELTSLLGKAQAITGGAS